MARNSSGGRRGAVRGRTQFRLPDGRYAKVDRATGKILSIKSDRNPYKGVVVTEAPSVLRRISGPRQALPQFAVARPRKVAMEPRVVPFEQPEDARVAA